MKSDSFAIKPDLTNGKMETNAIQNPGNFVLFHFVNKEDVLVLVFNKKEN